jgi:hypothetical protein
VARVPVTALSNISPTPIRNGLAVRLSLEFGEYVFCAIFSSALVCAIQLTMLFGMLAAILNVLPDTASAETLTAEGSSFLPNDDERNS